MNTIYYLPGHGGRLATGLGQGLMGRGFDVAGREIRGDFRSMSFDDQIQSVQEDLRTHFWHEDATVVCNSFGCYLFLNAQATMQPFIGKVLLLSPIIGDFVHAQTQTSFSPPRSGRLLELAKIAKFNTPVRCEIHVGEQDWQSNPTNVRAFGQLVGIPVTVVPDLGHDLGKGYVEPLLDRWLVDPSHPLQL